ncbi:asparagine synthase (glutamine-hydrolyzing) [Piscirickettsia litoralis]|uniref:asparagine synthase (glutamine-hydrolyzing) n=1 Tax=Piscirickettsia litoralis TaxID=1891921 RepID=A0ABX3A388_9GAMM|nr:asparagine synthase (glutamine-hydrolyzing) [Piscirickettsia litoralis]ODN42975.1 asparagine synthase (glutamine-hydrolyzing) [Piscirickettsia litoralis]
MCGILGQINLTNAACEISPPLFKEALEFQQHRGPDGEGVLHEKNFSFGHKRLSIIDLSNHAAQPMLSEDQQVVLTFNGEIYNYLEIKQELVERGYIFKTQSDTEVLLNAYHAFGIACVDRLIGMFAFAIYDKRTQESYIVRDRLGIKPVYYWKGSDRLIFSSEVNSVLKLSSCDKSLNMNAVSSYFSYRYPILDDSFFDGIDSLAAGHYVHIKHGQITVKQYWNLADKFAEQQVDHGEDYYTEKLRELLHSSVHYRMIADVPVGSFLSGGVDSSVVTALMANATDKPIQTFTIGFKEEGYNEFEYSKVIAEQYNTNHHEIQLTGDQYIDEMSKLIAYKGAPLAVPNEVPLYLMSRELKKYITVVLSGEGADELFGGYGRIFRASYDYERLVNQNALSEADKNIFLNNFESEYGRTHFSSELEHFLSLYRYTSFHDKYSMFNQEIDAGKIEGRLTNHFANTFNEIQDYSYFNKMSYAFVKVHLPGLLQRLDTTTMAASVEGRVPFVDHRLVEFAMTVPEKYKLKWLSEKSQQQANTLLAKDISEKYDTPKHILKKSFEAEIPNSILYRKKMGFPVPLNDWFGGEFNDFAREMLLASSAKSRWMYDQKELSRRLEPMNLTNHRNAMTVWMMLSIELFCKQYF